MRLIEFHAITKQAHRASVERFYGTVPVEFFQPKMRQTFSDSVAEFPADLDACFSQYNRERRDQHSRDVGHRRRETISLFVSQGG